MANRKGPQQQTGFGATPFGAPVSSTPSLFGQPDASKPAFGQTTGFGQSTSTFGQNTGFGMAAPQQQTSLFGKPTGFGTPSTNTSTFGFGTSTQNTGLFGSTQAKPFGSTAQPLFGATTNTTQSGFGTGLFGQTNTQSTSLFGKPAQPTTGFGAPQSTFSFSTPASTQSSTLFGQSKPLFGQPTTNTGFGQTTGFGVTNTAPFGSTFAKPATSGFGTTQNPGFGTSLTTGMQQQQGTSLFGNTAAKPGGLFGSTSSTGLFSNPNTFQPNTGFGLQMQQPQQTLFPQSEQQNTSNLSLLTTDPFGDAPHLAGLEPKLKFNSSSVSATDPKELKSLLDASKKVDTYNNSKMKVVPIKSVKDSLFDGLSPKIDDHSGEYVKTNCRRLILKHRPSSGGDGIGRTDILKILSQEENKENEKEMNQVNPKSPTELKAVPLKLNFDNTLDDNTNIGSQTYNLGNSSQMRNDSNIGDGNHLEHSDDEQNDEAPTGSINIPKKHPAGIICTRPEYYTLPSLDELPQYMEGNKCIVKGFTIGRKGYGNVYFPDEMDVSNLNIDELVHFRYREINVYPDESRKPPVGQGLNRKAQITLDNVYPKRVGSNTLIKDVDELLQINFAEKLRRITVKKDAKFVDYRPETGSWVFKVDHFSRYGFNDSDEEVDQETAGKKSVAGDYKQLDPKRDSKVSSKPIQLEATKQQEHISKKEIPKEASEITKFGIEDDIFIDDDNGQFPGEEDILHQSMYVDHISEEEYRSPRDMSMQISYDPFRTSKSIQIMKSTLFADDDRSSDGGGSHISIMRQYLDIQDEVMSKLPLIREVIPKKRVALRPKVDKIYTFADTGPSYKLIPSRNYQDMAVFKGKSFKVGWNKGFEFYSVDDNEARGSLIVNTIRCGTRRKMDPLQECFTDALEIILAESTYNLDNENMPTFTISKSLSYLTRQSELFGNLLAKHNNEEVKYLHSIWTLAEALWGNTENTISNRRYLLSEWLKENTSYEEQNINKDIQDVFNLLTVYKNEEASNLALSQRCPQLALLISQLSLTNRTKFFLQEQIDCWYNSLTANHISESMKKMFLLLSGIPVKDEVNIFQDVDWKRAFGMHLWYICPAGASIEHGIELYKKAFEEHGYAERPNPPYESRNTEDSSFDILYHILMLYKTRVHRLSTALNPSTHTDDHLDYRLSWLLLQLFLSLEIGIIDISEQNKLCISFSNQLESLGEWEWAIFVLLHLNDNVLKKTLIMSILDRNLSQEADKESFESVNNLVNRMHIPPEWIHRVKGEKMIVSGRFFEAFNHLAHAKDYLKANDILVEHILPNLFINEHYDVIKSFIYQIQEGADNILNWNIEAGLFLNFLDLQDKVISLNFDNLMRLQNQLQSIADRLSSFASKTDQQKLCIAEMSKRCASVYEELCKKSQSNLFRSVYAEFVESLVMPPDYKRNEALCLIHNSDTSVL